MNLTLYISTWCQVAAHYLLFTLYCISYWIFWCHLYYLILFYVPNGLMEFVSFVWWCYIGENKMFLRAILFHVEPSTMEQRTIYIQNQLKVPRQCAGHYLVRLNGWHPHCKCMAGNQGTQERLKSSFIMDGYSLERVELQGILISQASSSLISPRAPHAALKPKTTESVVKSE